MKTMRRFLGMSVLPKVASCVILVLAGLILMACSEELDQPIANNSSRACREGSAFRFELPVVERKSGMVLVSSGCRNNSRPGRAPAATDDYFCVGDFWMDTTELTIREYGELTGGANPSFLHNEMYPKAVPPCPECPQENLTYFEAILAANTRTKRDFRPMDTIYSYDTKVVTEIVQDPNWLDWTIATYRMRPRYVSGLTNLKVDTTKNGYRLPAREEWIFSALESQFEVSIEADYPVESYQWTHQTDSGTTHPVGSRPSTLRGLHDMEGNAWEWVFGNSALGGGWIGAYSMTSDARSTGFATAGVRFVRRATDKRSTSVVPRGCR